MSATAGTLALLCCVAYSMWYAEEVLIERQRQDLHFTALRERVLYFDEILTGSARLAAATGDPRWEARYHENEPKLVEVLDELVALAPDVVASELGGDTQVANERLVAMELEAFALVRSGRLPEAQALLLGDEYGAQKRIYAAGMDDVGRALSETFAVERSRVDAHSHWVLFGAFLGLLFLGIAWLQVARNVTRFVREREARLRILARANREKNRFVASMSHELRTPMTAILGFSDELTAPDVTEKDRRAMVETIRRNGEHLLDLINDLLDLSKIEAGEFAPDESRFSPAELVRRVHDTLTTLAREKGIGLCLEAEALPSRVRTDARRLRQIVINLVANAVKFTSEGAVTIAVSMRGDALCVRVVDTGPGIRPEELDAIFEPFHQVEEISRGVGGVGLGLAISRKLARSLGGELTAESEVGKGSTFELVLPCAITGESTVAAFSVTVDCPLVSPTLRPIATAALDARILLVEDGADNQRLIRHILKKSGAEVDLAANGRIGVEAWHGANERGEPYDLILMDMLMPVMDGYEATREIRNRGYRGPIMALTAHAMATDRERCLQAGCDDYETKPIERSRLLAKILGLLNAEPSAASAAGTPVG